MSLHLLKYKLRRSLAMLENENLFFTFALFVVVAAFVSVAVVFAFPKGPVTIQVADATALSTIIASPSPNTIAGIATTSATPSAKPTKTTKIITLPRPTPSPSPSPTPSPSASPKQPRDNQPKAIMESKSTIHKFIKSPSSSAF